MEIDKWKEKHDLCLKMLDIDEWKHSRHIKDYDWEWYVKIFQGKIDLRCRELGQLQEALDWAKDRLNNDTDS